MSFFSVRRLVASVILMTAIIWVVAADRLYEYSLRDAAFISGWILLVAMCVLIIYGVRKRFTTLPLVTTAWWLQGHIYFGWLAGFTFLLHSGARLPTGGLETLLWLTTVLLFLSGIVGLLLLRGTPSRVSRRGERVIFERIPDMRVRLCDEVERIAVESVAMTRSSAIADFYLRYLEPFLNGSSHVFPHLVGRDAHMRVLETQLRHFRRYLKPEELDILTQIEERVRAKNNLDYQFAVQSTMKAWLYVHVPLTCGVIPLSGAHVMLAYGFGAGSL